MARVQLTNVETSSGLYMVKELIGEGGSGRVYRVLDELGKVFAAKLLDPTRANNEKRKRFRNELNFGLRNAHPNIVTICDHGVLNDNDESVPFYVMPYYAESLRSLMIERIEPSKILPYFAQVLDGIEAAHMKGVIHRDIKPENVLFEPNSRRLVVADFGIAHFKEEDLYTKVETSPQARLANFQYSAPEQRKRGQQVDTRCDIYALGLVLNEMFTGEIALGTGYKTVGSVAPEFAYLDELVTNMLRQSPSDRPKTIDEIKRELIGRKSQFVIRQQLDILKQTVVPISDVDDPLVVDPPRITDIDWARGYLKLNLHRAVNSDWREVYRNVRGGQWTVGMGPNDFNVTNQQAIIPVSEHDAQSAVDHFKMWLELANGSYGVMVRQAKIAAEEQERRRIQLEVEEMEKRKRILSNVKI